MTPHRSRTPLLAWCCGGLVLLGFAAGCGEFETGYFQGKVDRVTQEEVAKRYGPPHQRETQAGAREAWTYYVRGSGTSGYSGTARASYCRAYVLTFDDQGVLREWRDDNCATKPATITEPFSDRTQ